MRITLVNRPVLLLLVLGLFSPLVFTQCKTSAKSYKDVRYDPAKLKTPTGHGMDRRNYPFDENGNYRKDWVKNNTGGKDPSAAPGQEALSATQLAETKSKGKASEYPTYAEATAALGKTDPVGSVSASAAGITSSGLSEDLEAPSAMTLISSDSSLAEQGMELASATVPASASVTYHKVVSGDTLFGLAGRYHTSVSELKRVNGLSADSIHVGQSLRLP